MRRMCRSPTLKKNTMQYLQATNDTLNKMVKVVSDISAVSQEGAKEIIAMRAELEK